MVKSGVREMAETVVQVEWDEMCIYKDSRRERFTANFYSKTKGTRCPRIRGCSFLFVVEGKKDG
jgi:hypothetical protein